MSQPPFLKKLAPTLESYARAYNNGTCDYTLREFAKLALVFDDDAVYQLRIGQYPHIGLDFPVHVTELLEDTELCNKTLVDLEALVAKKHANAYISFTANDRTYILRRSKWKMLLQKFLCKWTHS